MIVTADKDVAKVIPESEMSDVIATAVTVSPASNTILFAKALNVVLRITLDSSVFSRSIKISLSDLPVASPLAIKEAG